MIYCVEDDRGIRELMIYTLNVSGFKAEGFKDSDELYEALKRCKPELITLDIMLPKEDGISILKKLKNNPNYKDIPIIMATAKGEEYDTVLGLDLGADDYLAKPFGMMEMVSRVKAVLRRAAPKAEDKLVVGNIEIDRLRHKVSVDGKEIVLTLKEFDLLLLFCENIGIVFTRDKLLERIWGFEYADETRTIDVHIGTLRTKLGSAGNLIETVRGVGYKMEVGK